MSKTTDDAIRDGLVKKAKHDIEASLRGYLTKRGIVGREQDQRVRDALDGPTLIEI